ncbi:MAG: hypothetical protein R3B54_14110 [Bdellovibrionota bacterium]
MPCVSYPDDVTRIGPFAGVGAALFLVTGGVDYLLRGSFHQSLFSYVDYNIHHSSSYGTTPFYTYFLLWIALLLPPTFLARYRDLAVRERYRGLSQLVVFFLVFLVSHSSSRTRKSGSWCPSFP